MTTYDISGLHGNLAGQPLRQFRKARIRLQVEGDPRRARWSWEVEIELLREHLKDQIIPMTFPIVLRDSAVEIEGTVQVYGYSVEMIEIPPAGQIGWVRREAGPHITVDARGVTELQARALPAQAIDDPDGILNIGLLHAIRNIPIEVQR
jgi:hypothetical protein